MTLLKPYLIRAVYRWIVDNQLTPYLLVNAEEESVQVMVQHIQDGKIILNVRPEAIENLSLGNENIEFDTKFNGVFTHLGFPISAVLAIYAKENGKGMIFDENEEKNPSSGKTKFEPGNQKPAKPNLKIVK